MDENLIYSIAAVIFGLIIGIVLLYAAYLKGILNKRDLKRGIANGMSFALFGIIITLAYFNLGLCASTIVVVIMCLILWVFVREIVKKRIKF